MLDLSRKSEWLDRAARLTRHSTAVVGPQTGMARMHALAGPADGARASDKLVGRRRARGGCA